ncbi:MAG TPA: hypothetical protein VKE40_03520 [Gemmataceae bacterium]|nr:hypothetical protein [Gemmataceae bacterium]
MGKRDARVPTILMTVLWATLLVGAYLAPRARPDDDPGDVVTRQTARVAVSFWGIAAAQLLLGQRSSARWTWTLACTAYLVHVATAFDQVHGWSHATAVRHVEIVSGFGRALFVSYAFSLLWIVDVAWWWIDRAGYDARPVWLDRLIHGFMAFVVFNGTVVFADGLMRWVGAVLFAALAVLVARRLARIEAGQ